MRPEVGQLYSSVWGGWRRIEEIGDEYVTYRCTNVEADREWKLGQEYELISTVLGWIASEKWKLVSDPRLWVPEGL